MVSIHKLSYKKLSNEFEEIENESDLPKIVSNENEKGNDWASQVRSFVCLCPAPVCVCGN